MAQKPDSFLNLNEVELEALARVAKPKLYKHTANIAGYHRSRTLINGGSDFAGLREYSPGDGVRSINWRASARSSQFQVHQYQQERGARWFICLDTSTSMGFPDSLKWQQAIQVCDALAYLLISAGNQLGLLTFNNTIEHFYPLGHGRQQYKKLHQLFDKIRPKQKGGDSCLHLCAQHIKQSASIFVISDFLQPGFMQQGLDKLLHSGHHLHALQIIAAEETDLAYEGQIKLLDCESAEMMQIESTAENRFKAEQRLKQHCHALALHCVKKHIHYSLAHSDQYWKDVLLEHISRI